MTPTPHGQVPEALIDLIDTYAETRHRYGRIHNARTEAARNAVTEALSGGQALSAAPAGWRELAARVMDALADAQDTTNSQYPEHVRCYPSWERHARWLRWHADMFRSGNPVGNGAGNPDVLAALAASPTPPAEQAAPKAAHTRTALPEGWTDCTIEFGNDGPEVVAYGPKRMMTRLAKWLGKYFAQVIAEAAPKAAPVELSADSLRHQNKLLAETLGACILASGIVRKDIDGFTGPELLHFGEDLRSMLALAPQQEAQGPCPTCVALARTVMLDQVSFDRKPDCYGIRQITDDESVEEWEDIRTSPDVAREEANDMMATGRGEIYEVVPLYTAPQPAPAPLSDDTERLEWLLWKLPGDALRYVVGELADTSSGSEFRAAIDAALAAQGGKA